MISNEVPFISKPILDPGSNTTPDFNPTSDLNRSVISMVYGVGTMANQGLRLPWDPPLDPRADDSQMAEFRSFFKTGGVGLAATALIGLTAVGIIAVSPLPGLAGSIGVVVGNFGWAMLGGAISKTATSMVYVGVPILVGCFAGAKCARVYSNSGGNVQGLELMTSDALNINTQRIFDKIACVGKLAVYESKGVVIDPTYLKKIGYFYMGWDASKSLLEILLLMTPLSKLAFIFSLPTMLFCMAGLLYSGFDIYNNGETCSKNVIQGDKVLKPGIFGLEQPRVMATTTKGIFRSKAYLLMDVCSATHDRFDENNHTDNLAMSVLKTAMGLSQQTPEDKLVEAVKKDPICAYGTLKALADDACHSWRSEGSRKMAQKLCNKGLEKLKCIITQDLQTTGNANGTNEHSMDDNNRPCDCTTELLGAIDQLMKNLNTPNELSLDLNTTNEDSLDDNILQMYAKKRDSITKLVDDIRSLQSNHEGTLRFQPNEITDALNSSESSIKDYIIALFLESGLIDIDENNDIKLNAATQQILEQGLDQNSQNTHNLVDYFNAFITQNKAVFEGKLKPQQKGPHPVINWL
jgi:hypothetical protein